MPKLKKYLTRDEKNDIIYTLRNTKKKDTAKATSFSFQGNPTCKPSSVENGHLSSPYVTVRLRGSLPVPPMDMRRANDPYAVLLRIGFTANVSYLTFG